MKEFKEKTPEEWAAEFVQEEYAPNREITGEYDKNLAVKCENGTFVGFMKGDVLNFRGIPFAMQPVGELRWKRPLPPEPSDKVFEACHNARIAIQPHADVVGNLKPYEMGEDCLALNIFSNTKCPDRKKAVMVWIHGGAYLSGGTATPLYNGNGFVTNNPDIILVTIAYRLGVLGFVNLSHIKGGEDYPDINLGTLDQIAALKWVKRNIAAFGGDPDRVTIFGESAGGGSSSVLTIHPEAKGLFKRAILQSGAVSQCIPESEASIAADDLAKHFKAADMKDMLAIPAKELGEYWETANVMTAGFVVAEKKTITADPFALYEKGETKDLDIMQGVMANEWRLFSALYQPPEFFDAYNKLVIDETAPEGGSPKYREICDKYRALLKEIFGEKWADTEFVSDTFFRQGMFFQAEQHAKNGGRGYVYIMNQPLDFPADFKAAHGTDIYYTFGTFDGMAVKGTVQEQQVSYEIQRMWANFAKTGDPSTEERKWPVYDLKDRATMIIGPDTHVENDPDKERRILIGELRDLSPAYQYAKTLSHNVLGVWKLHPEFRPKK